MTFTAPKLCTGRYTVTHHALLTTEIVHHQELSREVQGAKNKI